MVILPSTASGRCEPALRVNSVYGIYRAVRSGLGIAALPYYLSDEAEDLVEILPELKGPSIDSYFVYPEELRHSKRICVVRDFLMGQVEADIDSAKAMHQRSALLTRENG